MGSSSKRIATRLIMILQTLDRSEEDKELILSYLLGLPDLAKYLQSIPRQTLLEMSSVVKAEHYSPDMPIFNKGDYSNCFYLILVGKVQIYNTNKEGEITFSTFIGSGKRLGEQGVITSQPRSLSAVAVEHTFMLVMTRPQFKTYLQAGFLTELGVQLSYIEQFLPSIEHYSYIQKIMIAYCLKTETYCRGQVILPKGVVSQNLYIVIDGEAEIIACLITGKHSILKLARGALFGEEGVFLGVKTKHSIVCASQRVNLFFIRKFDAVKVLPEEIMTNICNHYKAKEKNRLKLSESKIRSDIRLHINTGVSDSTPTSFAWASPFARRKLVKMQHVKSISSLNTTKNEESYQRRKSILMQLTDEDLKPAPRRAFHSQRSSLELGRIKHRRSESLPTLQPFVNKQAK
jgi:CRP-like cAMP-binding protein